MTDAHSTRYRAFISYSHHDGKWCDWLHKALENYSLDPALLGRETTTGRAPVDLRPIFRDRDEFSSGSLKAQTLAALEGSQFLIVVASPDAATSRYVNEEIRQFKAMGGAARVLAIIVAGEPPDCFPPALRFRLGEDGAVTETPEDVIAADALKDGKERALVKIVAGLTGLPFDDLWMREVKATKKRAYARAAAIGAFGVVAIAAGFFGQEHWGTKKEVDTHGVTLVEHDEDIKDLKKEVADAKRVLASLAASQAQAAPGQVKEADRAVDSIAQGAASGDPRLRQALDLLAVGKVAEATSLLDGFASNANAEISSDVARLELKRKDAAVAYRNLGAIASLHDPRKAREAYAKAVELDPTNAEGLLWNGWFQIGANMDGAEKSFRALLALEKDGADPNLLFWARVGLGDIAGARGDLDGAVALYREAETKLAPSAEAKPGDVILQYDRAAAKEKLGDVYLARGDLDGALKMYLAKNDVVTRFADADPANAAWKLAVSATGEKLGDVYRARGDRAAALDQYRASLERMRPVRDADPSNLYMQRSVSVLYDKIGDLQLEQGDPLEALANYKSGQEIAMRLTALDPESREWRRDLSISYNRVGDALAAKGDLDAALKSYRASLDIVRRLVDSDPRNAEWRNDLAVSYNNIGDVLAKQGDHAGAMKIYRSGHEIREALAAADPSNAQWHGALLASHVKLGDFHYQRREYAEALKRFRAALDIAERLARLDASNSSWKRSLSVLEDRLGDVLVAQGDKARALQRYRANLAARESLAASDPRSATARKDLAVSYWKLGILLADMRETRQAREALTKGRAIMAEAVGQHPDWAEGKQDLEKFDAQIARLDGAPADGGGTGEKRKVRRK